MTIVPFLVHDLLHGQRSFPLHCSILVLTCKFVHVNASTPFKNMFKKFFSYRLLKICHFFTFEWSPFAQ